MKYDIMLLIIIVIYLVRTLKEKKIKCIFNMIPIIIANRIIYQKNLYRGQRLNCQHYSLIGNGFFHANAMSRCQLLLLNRYLSDSIKTIYNLITDILNSNSNIGNYKNSLKQPLYDTLYPSLVCIVIIPKLFVKFLDCLKYTVTEYGAQL